MFLEHGARGLKSRVEPEERELTLARAKIGELIVWSWPSTSSKEANMKDDNPLAYVGRRRA